MQESNIRVLFSCTGVGILNRGIESFFRDAFDGLRESPGINAWLIKGGGPQEKDEIPVWCLPRTGFAARWLGAFIRRNAYVAEQLSSFPFVAHQIQKLKPDVVFYSDSNLGFQLFRWRKKIGGNFRLLFSNGGPCRAPFIRTDFVHQVAPLYLEHALRAGEPIKKHFFVPYGIKISESPILDPAVKHDIRKKLRLPPERQIVLSVGWISREHKRMDYVINEIAKLPEPRPFVQLLGAMDQASDEVLNLARKLLGSTNFAADSVTHEKVSDYYRAADCFVLASLEEGFGRVYIEALMHGLPVIAHRYPVMEYVLGGEGVLGDLNESGTLANLIHQQLAANQSEPIMRRRWESVRSRFSWQVLAQQYHQMFKEAAERQCKFQ